MREREYVTAEDLACINRALALGEDVRIQVTPSGGCRIVSDRVRVLRRRSAPGEDDKKAHFGERSSKEG